MSEQLRRSLKTYRLKDPVEAMRWTDTDENRELFAAWFEEHGWEFETRGHEIVLPQSDDIVAEGEWIVYVDDNCDFIAMTDGLFQDKYEEVSPS